jgi:hypothetical protein
MPTCITFGAGNENFLKAVDRLTNQAKQTNLFDNVIGYTDEYLRNDKEFWEKHSNFILSNPRGYGYWIWKPYIIKKTLEQMTDGDKLLYLDCGCEIHILKKNIIKEKLDLVKKNSIISTNTLIEKEWNKMDLIIKLGVLDDKYLNSRQKQAGVNLYFVCDKIRNFVNEWYELCCDYHNIDNTPSVNKNFDCFKEHRNDQSVFSLLGKKYNLFDKEHHLRGCIEIFRNNTGVSRINNNSNKN